MEPLFPASGRGELTALSVAIIKKAGELTTALPSVVVRREVAQIVCEMNSYYSNLIEGHKTMPRDIEKALNNDFSEQEDDRRNQRMSVAHIQTEKSMHQRLNDARETDVYSPEFINWLHREFYSYLPDDERFTVSKSGTRLPLSPGQFRDFNVDVGRHIPPHHQMLEDFLHRFQSFYSSPDILASDQLIALASAHHRLAWIHPFGDGNGRMARLQSHAAMVKLGLDSGGLWTLSRGLAREKSSYYSHLQSADQKRSSDFDGRGNLSDQALFRFCEFFLTECLDQIDFMLGVISPFKLQDRIEHYIRFTRVDLDGKLREHLIRLLKALCLQGEIARGLIPDLLGLKGSASREVVRKALGEGLVASHTEKGPLRIVFPNKVVKDYFPQLFTNL